MNVLTAIMDVEMLYFHTHKQVILKSNNLTISQFEVSYEVLFISFSTTLFQYFSIILEKINIIQITKSVAVSCTCFKMLDAIYSLAKYIGSYVLKRACSFIRYLRVISIFELFTPRMIHFNS